MMNQATAIAHPNIALIKYWGKRDAVWNLPATSSLSLTLDAAPTTTTVALADSATDTAVLNGAALTGRPLTRVQDFLGLVRELADPGLARYHASVISHNEIPTGAGLASSASGFAALAGAAAKAYGLELSDRELSRLARRGSGSASRSIFPGLVQWHAGVDDATSFAEPIPAPPLDLGMLLVLAHTEQKAISSTEAMNRTTATSPFFPAWEQIVASQLAQMREAIAAGDVDAMGQIAESNAIRMHATMLGATPPVRYWTALTMQLLDATASLRAEGLSVYGTMDAGPNVKLLVRASQAVEVARRIQALLPEAKILNCRPGPGISYRATARPAGGESAGGENHG